MVSNFLQPVYRLYESLVQAQLLDPNSGLGGKLLYAGEIEPQSRDLLYAANIAGAASLAASADPAVLRAAMRDGVIDFFVNSLEEALRILKNEIRKRQTVSVGVAADPDRFVEQMLERGVLPDLLPSGSDSTQFDRFLSQGSRQIAEPAFAPDLRFVTWQVDRDFARWLPQFDDLAKAVLPPEDHMRQRWLRLAPRYLGRLAQRQRSLALTEDEFAKFEAQATAKYGETGTAAAEAPKISIEKWEF